MSQITLKLMSNNLTPNAFTSGAAAFFQDKREIRLTPPLLRTDQWDDLRYNTPDAVLIEDGDPNGQVSIIDAVRQIDAQYPHIAIIVIVHQETDNHNSAPFHRQLMKEGALGVLTLTHSPNFQEWVRPIIDAVQKKRRFHHKTNGKSGEIITLHSLKGGVGKTIIGANVSTALAQNQRVLFLDLNWPFGGSHLFLDFTPSRSILDLLPVINDLTPANLEIVAMNHPSTPNLDIIAAPLIDQRAGFLHDVMQENLFYPAYDGVTETIREKVEGRENLSHLEPIETELLTYIIKKAKAKQATVQLCRRLLMTAQSQYDTIIVDAPTRFDEEIASVIRMSNQLWLVCNPDVTTLQSVRTQLDILPHFVPDHKRKTRLLLNRVQKGKNLLSPEKLREIFHDQTWLPDLPDEPKMPLWVNTSTLAVNQPGRTPFTKAVRALAETVMTDTASPTRKSISQWFPLKKPITDRAAEGA